MSQAPAILSSHAKGLVERADFFRVDATRRLDPGRRTTLGQFLTPAPVARLMASMFKKRRDHIDLLDAGAGVGVLTAVGYSRSINLPVPPLIFPSYVRALSTLT